MENLLSRGPTVTSCFSWSAVVSLCSRDWHNSLSAEVLYKGRAK